MTSSKQGFDLVRLSRKLSKVLRHTAKSMGIPIDNQGFVKVNDLLAHPSFQGISFEELQWVVHENDKQRYTLLQKDSPLTWYIKANQGHSMPCITNLELTLVPLDLNLSIIHATFRSKLPTILNEGLKPMNRLHIHFADNPLLLRASSDVHIYMNMSACLKDNIVFYRAPNGVILSTGKNGEIPSSYFLKIEYVEPRTKQFQTPRKEKEKIDESEKI